MTAHISIGNLVNRFWKKALPTWVLVFIEGISILAMPLVIGRAVDDLLKKEFTGIFILIGLCAALLILGAGRRFYDTRIYAGIYKTVAREMVGREKKKDTSTSKVSARLTLFTEFVEFLENSLPEIINHMIGMAGTLCIIVFLDIRVFMVCATGMGLTVIIFALSKQRMLNLNKGQNDEFEQQVEVISSKSEKKVARYLNRLMSWNIRLSDLETVTFSLTWIVLAAVLIVSILLVTLYGSFGVGHILTMVMYVFGVIESVLTFPLYYQQLVRLQEITQRLG